MDIIICAALVVIAVCMLNGKSINITITHKQEKDPLLPCEPVDENALSMDGAIKIMNEVMGVFNDDEGK